MDTFETIKKFLTDGGKCLLIENGKPVGVVLTIEEYSKLQHLPEKDSKEPTPKFSDSEQKKSFSAELSDINFTDDNATLEDLGLDELPY